MKQEPVDISAIIVSWNAKSYLKKCLDSLLKEAMTIRLEIVVVDNASTDGSAEMVEIEYPQVIFIQNVQNLGFARANNIGIDHCQGRYICLINSDVVVYKGCFLSMLAYMDSNTVVGVLGPKVLKDNGELQHSCFSYPSLFNVTCRALALDTIFPRSALFGKRLMRYWKHDEIRNVDALSGCFLLVRRKAMDQVGKLDELFFIYGEDIDWCKRFHTNKWKVTFFPNVQITHFGAASSANAPIRFYLEKQRANLRYWKKHHSSGKWFIYIGIMIIQHAIRLVGRGFRFIFIRDKGHENVIGFKRDLATLLWYIGINPRFLGD